MFPPKKKNVYCQISDGTKILLPVPTRDEIVSKYNNKGMIDKSPQNVCFADGTRRCCHSNHGAQRGYSIHGIVQGYCPPSSGSRLITGYQLLSNLGEEGGGGGCVLACACVGGGGCLVFVGVFNSSISGVFNSKN